MKSKKADANLLFIRMELRLCNYTLLSDYAGKNKKEWLAYRKALRALPKDPKWPDVVFPESPPAPPLIPTEADADNEIIEPEETEEDES